MQSSASNKASLSLISSYTAGLSLILKKKIKGEKLDNIIKDSNNFFN